MKTIIILFFIGFNLLFSYSQENIPAKDNNCPDYIISNGDTIRCYVITEEPYNIKSIKYKLTRTGKATDISIANVSEIKNMGVCYYKIVFNKKMYLMQRIIQGDVSLYILSHSNSGSMGNANFNPTTGQYSGSRNSSGAYSTNFVYYITNGKKVDEIKKSSYKEVIKSYITNPIYNERIENLKYKDLEIELENLVIESNKKQESQ